MTGRFHLFHISFSIQIWSYIVVNGNNDFSSFNHIHPKTSATEQEKGVRELLQRLLPQHANQFVIHINNSQRSANSFAYDTGPDDQIHIYGSTGVSAAAGVYHYLKYWCNCHLSWSGNQLQLPVTLPRPYHHHEVFNEQLRYYANVVTFSYSMVWWDWKRWEREIDWMALNGINFPLAFTAQEAVWRIVYQKLGLTEKELDNHFAGPAFLAWQRMGNLDGWGGPLPISWHKNQLEMQQRILQRMRNLGMIPILPGFAGHIPKALVQRLHPHVRHYNLPSWNGFPGTMLLDSTETLFKRIASLFIKTQEKLYNGTDHVYSVDVFNELVPPHLTTQYIYNVSKSIFKSLQSADKQSVWVMQAWMFRDTHRWTPNLIKAWVSAVPVGQLILLDLASDIYPIYQQTGGYYGHPFIWCMIENFGGTTRMYGKVSDVMTKVAKARKYFKPYMIGLGLTPEGINQNYINFEIMSELMWRDGWTSLSEEWIVKYVSRRYGVKEGEFAGPWKILLRSVYDCHSNFENGKYLGRVPVMRPFLTDNLHINMWYDPKYLYTAWQSMINSIDKKDIVITDTLKHDLTILGTQVLEDIGVPMYKQLVKAYRNNSLISVYHHGTALIDLMLDMDLLLSTDHYSLLGVWLESAKRLGTNELDKKMFEYNARNQITLWGPHGEIHDYANKNWAGLMRTFYTRRWNLFFEELCNSIEEGIHFNERNFLLKLFSLEDGWTRDHAPFPSLPEGDTVKVSKKLLNKYKIYYN